jgi:GntR family transcriptional regulator
MVRRAASLAQQIILEIVSEIESGTLPRDDGLLPSETELSRRFGVSRATVREALSKLELTGAIIRRQGIGTYVNSRRGQQPTGVRGWFDDASALIDFVRDSDRAAQAKVLECYVKPADGVAERLEIRATSQVVAIEKVFLSAAVPVIHCVNLVPLNLLETELIPKACELFAAAESAYQFLDQWCHLRVHHQQSEVRAVCADERMARLLGCERGAALLRVEEVGYSTELLPIFYGLNHFRGDLVTFRQVRHPSFSIGPLPLTSGCNDAAQVPHAL